MSILKSVLEALAVGDALGMPTEFMTQKAIDEVYPEINGLLDPSKSHTHFELPYCSVTDDTEQHQRGQTGYGCSCVVSSHVSLSSTVISGIRLSANTS